MILENVIHEKNENVYSYEATAKKNCKSKGKKGIVVITNNYINTVQLNAMAKINMVPLGKFCDTKKEALDSYKSQEMKAIIEDAFQVYENNYK